MALAALSLVIFLATPLPPIYGGLTETGLVITWDAMEAEGFTHYIVDIYSGTDLVRMMFCGV